MFASDVVSIHAIRVTSYAKAVCRVLVLDEADHLHDNVTVDVTHASVTFKRLNTSSNTLANNLQTLYIYYSDCDTDILQN